MPKTTDSAWGKDPAAQSGSTILKAFAFFLSFFHLFHHHLSSPALLDISVKKLTNGNINVPKKKKERRKEKKENNQKCFWTDHVVLRPAIAETVGCAISASVALLLLSILFFPNYDLVAVFQWRLLKHKHCSIFQVGTSVQCRNCCAFKLKKRKTSISLNNK